MDLNAAVLLQSGFESKKVINLRQWRDEPGFSPIERCVLEYAETVTQTGAEVEDRIFSEMQTHFGESELVQLTAWICLEKFYSKFNHAFQIQAQDLCRIDLHQETA
jgi:alkylhydroperoxidase family enzyme